MVYSKDDNESRGRVAFINLLFYFMESKHKIKEFALYKEAFTTKMERYYNCLWRLINIPYKKINQFYIHDIPQENPPY